MCFHTFKLDEAGAFARIVLLDEQGFHVTQREPKMEHTSASSTRIHDHIHRYISCVYCAPSTVCVIDWCRQGHASFGLS